MKTELILKNLINEKLTLKKVDTIIQRCPYCGAKMSIVQENNNATDYLQWVDINRYSYDDGDCLDTNEDNILLSRKHYDTFYMHGNCRKCNEIYFSVFIDICSVPYDKQYLFIISEPIEIFEKINLYEVILGHKKIGMMEEYIEGEYEGIIGTYYRFTIGTFVMSDYSDNSEKIAEHIINSLTSENLIQIKD